MPLVLMCGQPCSGKSRVAQELAAALQSTLASSGSAMSVMLIDEPSLNLDRTLCYKDMPSEKNVRGVLRSAVDRSVTRDCVVIVDSLNSIKGYRYELWCLARAAGTHYCVVHCDASAETARKWNAARLERGEVTYPPSTLEDLLRRFEAPNRRNRWDRPLFEVHPAQDSPESTAAVLEEVVALLTDAESRGPGGKGPRNLQPTIATQSAQLSETNRLYEMDRATQEVVSALVEAQAAAGGGLLGDVRIGDGLPSIRLQRPLGLPELRRHKRTFLKLAGHTGLTGPAPPSDTLATKRMFADYLNHELAAGP